MAAHQGRTVVYRLYDTAGELLYIGISEDPTVRFKQHRALQPWWFQVDSNVLEWFDSRADAEKAEREAIGAEAPRWNREHMPSYLIRRDVPIPPPRETTDDELRVEEIRTLTERMAADRSRVFELIPQVFPEKRGEEPVRGRLNEVVKASGFTREYVARIRDGKVTPS